MTNENNNKKIEITKKHFFLYINIFILPFFVSWVTQILEGNSKTIQTLGAESETGRKRIKESAEFAANILDKSKGLVEASAVVQSIASQTNLEELNKNMGMFKI